MGWFINPVAWRFRVSVLGFSTAHLIASTSFAIMNGTPTNTASYPYMASIRAESQTLGGGLSFCGGALVRNDAVITSASCLEDNGTSILNELNDAYSVTDFVFVVHIGRVDISNPAETGYETRSVSSNLVHEGYEDITFSNDIGILYLQSPSTNKPVGLLTGGIVHGEPLRVLGYGASGPSEGPTDTLEYFDSVALTNRQFNYEGFDIDLADGAFLADPPPLQTGGPCQGDSGGPGLVARNGTNVLAGLVSWGFSCGSNDVYTAVSDYQSWLSDNLGVGSQPPSYAPDMSISFASNNMIRITFVSGVGEIYRVLRTPTLVQQQWTQFVSEVTGNGATQSVTDAVVSNMAVYQLVQPIN